jgi:hypothetical protein
VPDIVLTPIFCVTFPSLRLFLFPWSAQAGASGQEPPSSPVGAGRPCALRSRGFNRQIISYDKLPLTEIILYAPSSFSFPPRIECI